MKKTLDLSNDNDLLEWALNYYDEKEPEPFDILATCIEPSDEILSSTAEKLQNVINRLEIKTSLTKQLNKKTMNVVHFVEAFLAVGITGFFAILIAKPEILTYYSLGLNASSFGFVISAIIHYINRHKAQKIGLTTPEYTLKKKLDKKHLKAAKKNGGKIEFGEDEFTLLHLKTMYNDLIEWQKLSNLNKRFEDIYNLDNLDI